MYAICNIIDDSLSECIKQSTEQAGYRMLARSPVTLARRVMMLQKTLLHRFIWQEESKQR